MPTIDSVEAWIYKNTVIMAQTLVLAAVSHGLETCMMEGYDVRRTKNILRIPDRYGVPLMVVMGYEYESELEQVKETPRLKEEEVVFGEEFGKRLDLWNDNDSEGLKTTNTCDMTNKK